MATTVTARTETSISCPAPSAACASSSGSARADRATSFAALRTVHGTEQLVAVKLFHAHRASAQDLERFAREQQLLAALTHPDIVRLHRRRRDRRRPAVPGHGAGRRPAHHRLLRPAPPRARGPAAPLPFGVRRGAVGAPAPDRAPRSQAVEHPGVGRRRTGEAARLRRRQARGSGRSGSRAPNR